jgi:hypothetical protein
MSNRSNEQPTVEESKQAADSFHVLARTVLLVGSGSV